MRKDADQGWISLRGVRVNNLKNIDVDLPRGRLIAITGVSGSGKSSLGIATLYAEGQRRFIESLSPSVKQFIEQHDKPDVDSISGIPPAIAIRRRNFRHSPRSTVATATELAPFLRMLFARVGKTCCRECGREVRADSPASAAAELAHLPVGTKLLIVFRTGQEERSLSEEQVRSQLRKGFTRGILDENVVRLEDLIRTESKGGTELAVVVDRLTVGEGGESEFAGDPRLIESLETAFSEAPGAVEAWAVEPNQSQAHIYRFSELFECADCRIPYSRPQPRNFSLNDALFRCDACDGTGKQYRVDLERVIPDREKSIDQGAIVPWLHEPFNWPVRELRVIAHKYGIRMDTPLSLYNEDQWRILLDGEVYFPGIYRFFEMLEAQVANKSRTPKKRVQARAMLDRFREEFDCPQCGGTRYAEIARQVQLTICEGEGTRKINIANLEAVSLSRAREMLDHLVLSPVDRRIAREILQEARRRLSYLVDARLGYLNLSRPSNTLSHGEAQRMGLACALGSGLSGTLFVLDEPSVGLHPTELQTLIDQLRSLTDRGNTVVVIEHDLSVIESSDWVLELGPQGGEGGGQVIYSGPLAGLRHEARSLTAPYMDGRSRLERPAKRKRGRKASLRLVGAHTHNLKRINLEIPLNRLVCVTGPSGAGKSSLVADTLVPALQNLRRKFKMPVCLEEIRLKPESIEPPRPLIVDQSPVGQSHRSTPGTYVGFFTDIRQAFASRPLSHIRGYTASTFSFNHPGSKGVAPGRCPHCQGIGQIPVEMHFLPDLNIPCDHCDATRYQSDVLEVTYRGLNIAQVLELTIDQAARLFSQRQALLNKMRILQEVGLGYLRLGQSLKTLSGGELQRLKLALQLVRPEQQHLLYIFDEPTTGLHMEDIRLLMNSFDRLLSRGHSVLVVEHHPGVMRAADYIIDLGPGGGEEGGRLVAHGTPAQVARSAQSATAPYLRLEEGADAASLRAVSS